jgi:hypothetical protein
MKSILDPSFKYYPSVDTDLRRTFQRIREEMRRASIARSERRQPAALRQIAFISPPAADGGLVAIGGERARGR